MAAILNGFLPRRRDTYAQERILNTRWGDSSISAPIHGGWNTNPSVAASQESPDLDRDLPPTPPHTTDEQDGVFIVRDDDEGHDDSEDDHQRKERDNITITIPLPWKKKSKSHARQPSTTTNPLNARFAPPRRFDVVSPPPLATAEAAAIPLPESRVASPIGRATTTSPVLSFRSRLASPNLGDMLSPVAEGFAKTGPATRPAPVLSPLQYVSSPPLDRPPTAGSIRSRRPSLDRYNTEGLGTNTMSSQSHSEEQAPEMQRPSSRGIGATAHMRASSRGPRAGSRGPRAPSVEPFARRAPSVEPVMRMVETTTFESEPILAPAVLDLEPVRRRAPSVEPGRRRAPSIEPVDRRAPSLEPTSRRAPSVGPSSNRRAVSREPRGRRGQSIEPRPRVRFMSEAPISRNYESSSNDGSIESDSDKDVSLSEIDTNTSRFEREYKSTRLPLRRRSIASPITSPTAATFGITEILTPPAMIANLESIAARAELAEPAIARAPAQRSAPRNRSKSRTRGLYGDMQDDFRLLARDVHIGNSHTTVAHVPTTAPITNVSQLQATLTSPQQQRAASPALSSNPPGSFATGLTAAAALRVEPERTGYSSDSSIIHNVERAAEHDGGKAVLAALARERKDQLRREERERAREKVARKLEHERERLMAMNALSDCESTASGHISSSEKTRRVYGGSIGSDTEFAARKSKTLVPNAEEIWG